MVILSDVTTTDAATGTRSRTRQAILAAAVKALAADSGASLGDIAVEAGVGRTTVHRYFAERSDLMAAVTTECSRRLQEADVRARLDDGPGREAVLRVCREYFDLGDVLSLIFHGVVQLDDPPDGCVDDSSVTAFERGQADGSIDAAQPVAWLSSMLWCVLYAGWSWTNESGGSRHDALDLVVRSLDGSLRPRD